MTMIINLQFGWLILGQTDSLVNSSIVAPEAFGKVPPRGTVFKNLLIQRSHLPNQEGVNNWFFHTPTIYHNFLSVVRIHSPQGMYTCIWAPGTIFWAFSYIDVWWKKERVHLILSMIDHSTSLWWDIPTEVWLCHTGGLQPFYVQLLDWDVRVHSYQGTVKLKMIISGI